MPSRPTTLLEAFANTAEALQQFGVERVRIVGLSCVCTADEAAQQQPSTLGADGVRVITEQEFMREFMFCSRPCIIVGAIDAWPALERWRSDTYLFDLDHHLPMGDAGKPERQDDDQSDADTDSASESENRTATSEMDDDDSLKPKKVTVALTPNGRADAVTYVLYDREDVPAERRDEICNGTAQAPVARLTDHPLRCAKSNPVSEMNRNSDAEGENDIVMSAHRDDSLCMEKIFMYAAEVKVTLPELYQLLAQSPIAPGERPSYIDMRCYRAAPVEAPGRGSARADDNAACRTAMKVMSKQNDARGEAAAGQPRMTDASASLVTQTLSLRVDSSAATPAVGEGEACVTKEHVSACHGSFGAVPVVAYAQMQNNCLNTEYTHLHEDLLDNVEAFGKRVFGGPPEASNVWFGIPASVSSMHQDWVENLYSVVRGVKEFVLIPPWEGVFVPKPEIPAAAFALDEARSNMATREFFFKPYPDKDNTAVPWMDLDFEGSLLSQEDGEAQVQALLEAATPAAPASLIKDGRLHVPQRQQQNVANDGTHASARHRLHPLVAYVHPGETLYLPAMWLHRVAQHADETDVRARALHRSSARPPPEVGRDAHTESEKKHEDSARTHTAPAPPLPLIAAVNYWYDMSFVNPAVVMLREFGLLL